MTDCNPIEQQARQDQLEALYEADGRDNPEHPMHCLYTGLVAGQKGGGRVMANLRYRVWDRCTRRIPEGTIMPLWAVALNVAVFPVRAIGTLLYRRIHPFDPWTLCWNINGARFSDHALMLMAGRLDQGWYKFTRGADGTVIVERRMEDHAQAAQEVGE